MVRVPPEIHRKLAIRAAETDKLGPKGGGGRKWHSVIEIHSGVECLKIPGMKNYGETDSLPVKTDRASQQFMHFTGRATAGQNGAFARSQPFAQIQANGKAGLAGGGVFNTRADVYRQFFKDYLLMGRNCGHREDDSTAQSGANKFHRTAQRVSILMTGRHGKTLRAVFHHGPPICIPYGQSTAHVRNAR